MKKGIKIQFIPFSQLASMSSYKRVKFILENVKDKIIIIQGKLTPEEEKDLIEETMKKIGKGFKGIEIEVLNPKFDFGMINKIKKSVADFLVGDRDAITLIGPASVIKEIKKDIKKLEFFLKFK